MALLRDLSASQLVFQVADGEIDQFQVIRYRGTEGLCQLYRFDIDVACTTEVDFKTVIGKAAVLSINAASGEKYFHGIVSRFELTDESGQSDNGRPAYHDCHYRIELVPTLWLLTHRYQSRIHQNKTTKDIITDVLTLGGIQSDRYRFELSGTYEPREYCVQYRETDYNFISRLMEEEGIFWYFEQTNIGHILVMADSDAAYQPIPGTTELVYRPPTGMNNDEDHVFRFRMGHTVRPGKVTLRDFNFKTPGLDLMVDDKADTGQGREFSDYPGDYDKQGRGRNLAKLRQEEFNAGRSLGLGQSSCQRLAPALKFTLQEHPVESLNAEYVITRVTHQGKQSVSRTSAESAARAGLLDTRVHQSLVAVRQHSDPSVKDLADAILQVVNRFQTADPTAHRIATQWLYHAGQVSSDIAAIAASAGGNPLDSLSIPNLLEDVVHSSIVDGQAPVYECRFECLPATVTYRPPRVTPWPVMRGTQTARIVGPKGEEIHTDEYGRVKVQFHWDREGKFDDKSSCWIRVAQPSVGGGYGMVFMPRVGQEVVIDFLEGNPDRPLILGCVYNADHMPPYKLPDQKTRSVIKTRSSKGGGGTNEIRIDDLKDKEQILFYAQRDMHTRIKKDRVNTIEENSHETIEGERFELIKKATHMEVRLDVNEKIGGAVSRSVKGNVTEEFKAKHSTKVTGDVYLKAGGKIVLEAGTEITLKVGGNFVKIDASGVTILGTMVKINSGGSAGSGSAGTLKEPKEPLLADKVESGKDTTYSQSGQLVPAETPPDIKGHEWKVSWIEVELVDEAGEPVVGEAVSIISPDGEKLSGITGKDGVANILVPNPGNCEIGFPNLDAEAWKRA